MHPKKFLTVALLIAAFTIVSQNYQGRAVAQQVVGEPVATQPGGNETATGPDCLHPVSVSDCARYCTDRTSCMTCANNQYPTFAQQPLYRAAADRCNDQFPAP